MQIVKKGIRVVSGQIYLFCGVSIFKCICSVVKILQPLIFSEVINNLLTGDKRLAIRALAVYFVIQLLTELMNWLAQKMDIHIQKQMNYEIKRKIIDCVFGIPPYALDNNTGKLIMLMTSDSNSIYFLLGEVTNFVYAILCSAVIGMIATKIDWRMAILIVAPYPIMLLINKYYRQRIKQKTEELAFQNDRFVNLIKNTFDNIKDVQLQGGKSLLIQKNMNEAEKGKRLSIQQGELQINNKFWINLVGLIEFVIFHIVGINLIIQGQLSVGLFVAFSTYAKTLETSLGEIVGFKTKIQPILVSVHRVLELLEKAESIFVLEREKEELIDDIRSISLNAVSVSYGPNKVLNNVSLHMEKGKIIGIRGENGSGKSTIAQIVANLIETENGEVLINGKDRKNYRYESIAKRIGFIGEKKILYYVSLQDNINLCNSSREQRDIFQLLNLDNDISKLERGLETEINENISMSSGQIQRVQIARIMNKECDVLIFDEGLSNLDYQTRDKVRNWLIREGKDKIIMIISHNEDDYSICDNVYRVTNHTIQLE